MNGRTLTSLARAAALLAASLPVAAATATPATAQHQGHEHGQQTAQKGARRSTQKAAPVRRAKTAPARKATTEYTCPMHPEVVSRKPGNCPKCEMRLRKKEAAATVTAAAARADEHRAAAPGAKMNIPDVELLDQNGRRVRFYTDLVKGRTVVVNFIFTTCTTVCPPLGATYARVQKELGERTGRDVHFISISVDPATDTPERLKAWGAKFKAGAGWTLVTGNKTQVDELLRALAASSARPEDHTPMTLIGNDAAGQWTRTYGLARPAQLIEIINAAAAGRLDSAAAGRAAQE